MSSRSLHVPIERKFRWRYLEHYPGTALVADAPVLVRMRRDLQTIFQC